MSNQLRDVCIIDGLRTPFVKSGADFKNIHCADLGSITLRSLLDRYDFLEDSVDEVIIGNVGSPPDTANVARVVALRAGMDQKISSCTVQRNCASALESVTTAFTKIQTGAVDVVLAGGTESMSNYPLLFSKDLKEVFFNFIQSKTLSKKMESLLKFRLSYLKPRISVLEGLTDPFVGLSMGQTAEVLSKEFGITRKEQDEFALLSHQKTVAAQKNNSFKDEITPVLTDHRFVKEDVGPRSDQSIEKLSRLRPYFDRKYGSVTVGNACPITDGAVALLMMSRERALSFGLKPQIMIRSFAYAGCSPQKMGLGPCFATPIALKKGGLQMKDINLIELNEAFSAQVLSCLRAFSSREFAQKNLGQSEAIGEVDPQKLNVKGGAIALGHPVGATGSRLVLTLMNEMKKQKLQYGLATLCIGGGQGGALILEQEI